MDQVYQPYRLQALIEAVVAAIDAAQAVDRPFFHLEVEEIFPAEVYAAMMAAMPGVDEYRPLPGRYRENVRPDGTLTRVKLDLLPEYIRHLDSDRRPIWEVVGRALASAELRSALVRRLAPGLARRFGKNYAKVGMYPVPILTPRHSRVSNHSSHRHQMEGNDRAYLSAGWRFGAPSWYDIARPSARRTVHRSKAHALCAKLRLCLRGRRRHLALRRSRRRGGRSPRQYFAHLFCRRGTDPNHAQSWHPARQFSA
jgi:hypothetical protein